MEGTGRPICSWGVVGVLIGKKERVRVIFAKVFPRAGHFSAIVAVVLGNFQ